MKRTVLFLLYSLGITVICPSQADPMPYGDDYLGEEKFDLQPNIKQRGKDFLNRLGQKSGLTLTNGQKFAPKVKESLHTSLGTESYESSKELIIPNLPKIHTKYNGPDWYGLNQKVMPKGQLQYANKNEIILSNSLNEFDLFVPDSWSYIFNKNKKGFLPISYNGQYSYKTDTGLILSDGQKQYEPEEDVFLINGLSDEDWSELNGGMSWYVLPNELTQYENIKELSLPEPKHIWYKPNVNVYLTKRLNDDKPTKRVLPIISEKSNYVEYETPRLNTSNLREVKKYVVKLVMRHKKDQNVNEVKQNIPKSGIRYNHKTKAAVHYDNCGLNLNKHRKHSKSCKERQTRFKIVDRYDRLTAYQNNNKQYQHILEPKTQYVPRVKTNYDHGNHRTKQDRHSIVDRESIMPNPHSLVPRPQGHGVHGHSFRPNPESMVPRPQGHGVHGHSFRPNPESMHKRPMALWEEYSKRYIPEILVRRPDNYWSENNNTRQHYQ